VWSHPLLFSHVQVLDDSTDKGTRDLVDDKVIEWRERGVEIEVRRRTNRAGYKAGALHEVRFWRPSAAANVGAICKGDALHEVTACNNCCRCYWVFRLKCLRSADLPPWFHVQGVKFLQDCEYIAIFDADFKPEPDFLLRTVPHLNPDMLRCKYKSEFAINKRILRLQAAGPASASHSLVLICLFEAWRATVSF